jgi:hypothetical protein
MYLINPLNDPKLLHLKLKWTETSFPKSSSGYVLSKMGQIQYWLPYNLPLALNWLKNENVFQMFLAMFD